MSNINDTMDYVMPNKIVEPIYCDIELNFSLGFIAEFDELSTAHQSSEKFIWIDLNDKESYNNYIGNITLSHTDIVAQIHLDTHCLFDNSVTELNCIKINNLITDSIDHNDHTLTIKVLGFGDHHRPLVRPNVSVRSALKLNSVRIESLDVGYMYDELCMSHNGVTSIFSDNATTSLNFSTPIYRWLFNNRRFILPSKYKHY